MVVALAAAAATTVVGQSVIVTAAGTDLVFGGAGRQASSAPLGRVSRVTVDPSGRPVFSDPNYHLVFRVEANGSISVIAGNNIQGLSNATGNGLGHSGGGYSGDEGPATNAALNRPEGVAYDGAGNLYIADVFNNRIRMVDTKGIIHTFAGTGQAGQQDSSQALSASFNYPTDVVADGSGNLYVNDNQNYKIRKITSQGVVSTIAGTGVFGSAAENASAATQPLADIEAMAVDTQGNLYLGDFTYNRVRRISGGLIATVAGNGNAGFSGDGPALNVSINGPGGLAFDQNGNLLISDTGNRRIRKLAASVITTIAGTGQPGFSGDGGPALSATLHNPFGLAVTQGGAIYIADRDNFRIRTINSSSTISTAAGNGALISSQNGVAAGLATMLDPFGVSFDYTGALLIADSDNNIIRRMTGGTLATIAGTGADEFSGDNGPATQAGLNGPFSVNADSAGNYYEAEANDGNVRKIGTSGLISTIASSSANGLNVPTQALPDSKGNVYISDLDNSRVLQLAPSGSIAQVPNLSNPAGIALDGLGNLYVTEAGAGKVVKVSSTGAVTTIAGGGSVAGTAADGGPATNARLGIPTGIAVDSTGSSVYFSDAANANVRKVALSSGTISTVAGNGRSGFSGDGGPATSASLGEPWGLALDPSGSLYIADVLNNRIRKVLLTSSPSFTVDQSTLSLSAASNGKITDPATLNLSSTLPGLLFSVTTDQPWLTITPASGAMPAAIQVTADPTGMTSGSNTGHVMITALGASPAAITVTVNFTVTPATPATLTSDTYVLNYSFVSGANPVTNHLSISNSGSGSAGYSISAALANGTGWLGVSPASGSATANSPGFVTVTITPGQLAPGTYTGTLTITGTGGTNSAPVQIPVSVSVTASAPKLLTTQPGLTFSAIQGGGAPLSQTFGVLNVGTGSMNWTVAVTTSTPWLSVSPASGTVVTPFTDASQVAVTANPSGLGTGTYYGLVSVTVPGNLVQNVTVALNVLSSGSGADVYPAGLVFTPPARGTNPSSQSVSIANLGSQPLTYTSSRLAAGQPWFVQTPASGVIAPNQTATIVVQPDFSSLQTGASGSIALQFSDGSHTTVSLLAVIPQTSVTPAVEIPGGKERAASTCGNPGIVNVTLVNPQPFNVVLGQGSPIQVKLSDNCGLVTGGNGANANAVFGNGDPTVNFSVDQTQPGSGIWTAPWTPISSSEGKTIQFIVTATETNATKPNQPKFSANVVTTTASAPVVAALVQNAASFVPGAISPGGLVTIYGTNLANTATSQAAPFPTSLGNMQVLLNDTASGTPLPLVYVSNSQVTAQISSDLPMLNTSYQMMVKVGSSPAAYSVGFPVNATAATPAVFTTNLSGQGQGAVLNVAYQLVDSSHPASPGDAVQIFCTGLGIVSPAVPTGYPASLTVLSNTVNPVTVTIGGMPAQVLFHGLAPGYAGLYQVNAVVPPGVPSGNQQVVLSVANQTSPAGVTIAIK